MKALIVTVVCASVRCSSRLQHNVIVHNDGPDSSSSSPAAASRSGSVWVSRVLGLGPSAT